MDKSEICKTVAESKQNKEIRDFVMSLDRGIAQLDMGLGQDMEEVSCELDL